jgi:hypothetical protein
MEQSAKKMRVQIQYKLMLFAQRVAKFLEALPVLMPTAVILHH